MRLLHLISYCLWKILVHPFVMVRRLRMLHLLPIFGNCHDTLGQAISLCTESSPDDARAAMSAFRWPSQVVAMAQPRKTNMTQVCRSGLVHNHSVLDAIFKFHRLLFRTWLVLFGPPLENLRTRLLITISKTSNGVVRNPQAPKISWY